MRSNGAVAFFLAITLQPACARKEAPADPARMAALSATYNRLHAQLEKAAALDPLVKSALADPGQVVIAIRASLVEELAGNLASSYLDNVTLDLTDVEAHGKGELRKETFLGGIKVGDWNITVDLGKMVGKLRAGTPRVSLRGPDLIDVELPVEVFETEGSAVLQFGWNSAGIANVVCKDFELSREIRGRVLAQRHLLKGSLRLTHTSNSLIATPHFPDRRVPLKLDLTPRSWAVVEEALRSQNTSGKCGTLMKPDLALERLRELGAQGVNINLPKSIFRTVRLPARFQESVKVNQHPVTLGLKAETLRIESKTLWSSASVLVEPNLVSPGKDPGSF